MHALSTIVLTSAISGFFQRNPSGCRFERRQMKSVP
jgi:hypothetical protein